MRSRRRRRQVLELTRFRGARGLNGNRNVGTADITRGLDLNSRPEFTPNADGTRQFAMAHRGRQRISRKYQVSIEEVTLIRRRGRSGPTHRYIGRQASNGDGFRVGSLRPGLEGRDPIPAYKAKSVLPLAFSSWTWAAIQGTRRWNDRPSSPVVKLLGPSRMDGFPGRSSAVAAPLAASGTNCRGSQLPPPRGWLL